MGKHLLKTVNVQVILPQVTLPKFVQLLTKKSEVIVGWLGLLCGT